MEQLLKQRVVGAAVLVSLAVIFIPMLLDGEPEAGTGITGSNIPLKQFKFEQAGTADTQQSVDNNVIAQARIPQPPVIAESSPVPVRKKPDPMHAGSRLAPTPAQDPNAKVKSWVVQVGSFSAKKNALDLRNRLRKNKYNAFIEQTTPAPNKVSYRVRVGPELDEKRANRIRDRLKSGLKVSGIVLRYR